MNKHLIVLGTIATVFLLISTVTAVPQVESTPTMTILNDIEQRRTHLKNTIKTLKTKLTDTIQIKESKNHHDNTLPLGLIDLLIKLLLLLIELVNKLIQLISAIFLLAQLIVFLIELIKTFVEWIKENVKPPAPAPILH